MTSSDLRAAIARGSRRRGPLLAACALALAVLAPPVAGQDNAPAPLPATSLRIGDAAEGTLAAMPAPETARVLTLDLTRDAHDIWDRIRRGFGMPDLDSQRVMDQQSFYLNRPRFLKQVFERGGRYLYYIVDDLVSGGMTTEIAVLLMYAVGAYLPEGDRLVAVAVFGVAGMSALLAASARLATRD